MKVKAVSKGFHVTMREPGDEFDIEGPVPKWCLKLAPEKGSSESAPAPGGDVVEKFTAKHAGAGRYRVEDKKGEAVGDFVGTKEEAQAEAERLNSAPGTLPDA